MHYRPPVPPSEVLSFTQGADVGLCLIEDACLSYRYCLPNKLFEYLLGGLPVVASDLPDWAQIVRQYQAGWIVPPKPLELTRFLSGLKAVSARELRLGLYNLVSQLSWENESKVLLSIYEHLLA